MHFSNSTSSPVQLCPHLHGFPWQRGYNWTAWSINRTRGGRLCLISSSDSEIVFGGRWARVLHHITAAFEPPGRAAGPARSRCFDAADILNILWYDFCFCFFLFTFQHFCSRPSECPLLMGARLSWLSINKAWPEFQISVLTLTCRWQSSNFLRGAGWSLSPLWGPLEGRVEGCCCWELNSEVTDIFSFVSTL